MSRMRVFMSRVTPEDIPKVGAEDTASDTSGFVRANVGRAAAALAHAHHRQVRAQGGSR